MKAVVMAGGFGTRIQPLTSSMPKPMIPVFNKPMMEYIIESLKAAGIIDIVILLYFKPEVIQGYFGDGSSRGVKIHYVLPDDDYGTAGAVKKAQKYLDDRFIIVSGDLISDFNIQEIIGFHEVKNSLATITLTSVPDPLQFGVVITDKESKILRFLEKPGWGEVFSDTINTGIYVFEPEILQYIPEDSNFDFSKDLFPKLMASGIDIFGYNAKGYWRDVGNPDSYRAALLDIMDGQVSLPMAGTKTEDKSAVVYTGSNTVIDESAKFEGLVVLADGCIVGKDAYVKNSVIGAGCVLEEKSRVTSSILWQKCSVGKNTHVQNAVLCDNVKLGASVRAEHGVIIAEGTEVGNQVIFEKDVMVWPEKQIEAGSIVSSNLIWGDKWKKSIFEGGKVSARTNVELSPDLAAKLGAALGSQLPTGCRVLMSRDYDRASRMLKRCFLGGLLSTGINVTELRMTPLPVMRHKLSMFGEVAGVYFRQCQSDPTNTEILFYDESAALIDSNFEKNIERVFFRENFRRATHDDIGEIYDQMMVNEFYKEGVLKNIDINLIKTRRSKIVVDLMNGTTDTTYPELLNKAGVDAVVLNAYRDEKKLSRTMHQTEVSFKEVTDIVKVTESEMGIVIYPHGERLGIITDKGEVLSEDKALLFMLKLIDLSVKGKVKVYLPAFAPSVMDDSLLNVEIVRGKASGIKADYLRNFYFTGDLNRNFTFMKNGTHADAMFSSLKMLEMMAKQNVKVSEVLKTLPEYHYSHTVINCPLELKGYLMRKMSEEAMDKDASFLDGIKITFKGKGWVHMVPDQFTANVHLYVEAAAEKDFNSIHGEYKDKINGWLQEQE
ncbi:MAG: sugar phosphate nucleotidyltransferase [Deferribacterales bacterium]